MVTFNDPRVPQRIWDKVVVDENDCWVWQGAKTRGYGVIRYKGKTVYAHRLVFSLLKELIKDLLDHQCLNRACCNPDHLKQADGPQNRRRVQSHKNSSSRFVGVSKRLRGGVWRGKWRARAMLNGKHVNIGIFTSELEAARARDKWVKENWPDEFYILNFPYE